MGELIPEAKVQIIERAAAVIDKIINVAAFFIYGSATGELPACNPPAR